MVTGQDESAISRLLAKYENPGATKKDVLDTLRQYKSLTYQLEKYVFNDGSMKDMFNLQGTIPVVYKGNTYHIPICIWLLDTHPRNAPMCYVKPTADMHIKVSMFVDHNGKIYLPYLHDWKPNSADLPGLIQVMIVTFGEHPPVYAKPKEAQPPYPIQSFMPQPNNAQGGYSPYPSSSSAFPPYPLPNSNFGYAGSNMSPYGGGAGGMSQTPYPPSTYPPVAGYNTSYSPSPAQDAGTIKEEHLKASLISAVEDKLRRRIQEKVNQCQAEIQTLKRTKKELTEGQAKINEIISRLEKDENELKKNISVLKDKEKELDKSLETIEKVNGIDVDEAVTTTAPLYKQILNSYAEEAAIDDAIYYLGEALRRGIVDLDVFLKNVRQLSRKQFMLRALMQKCRQKAGLTI